MDATTKLSTARKIWDLVTPAERRSAVVLLGLMCVGMVLETRGAGLMIPAITLLTQRDVARNYPALQPALRALGNPSEQTRVIGGMVARGEPSHGSPDPARAGNRESWRKLSLGRVDRNQTSTGFPGIQTVDHDRLSIILLESGIDLTN